MSAEERLLRKGKIVYTPPEKSYTNVIHKEDGIPEIYQQNADPLQKYHTSLGAIYSVPCQ
jgi:hypothetical protein